MAYPLLNKAERDALYYAAQTAQEPLETEAAISGEAYAEESVLSAKHFLLVCEGKNTERYYFEAFPVPTKTVRVLGGYGGGKQYLVDEAKKESVKDDFRDHEVWCVFDYDVKYGHPNQKADFDNAIADAERHGFRVAFSNDCFELWFLLHDRLIQNRHHRREYYDMLNKLWETELKGKSYEMHGKGVGACDGLYKRLLPDQQRAIAFAKRLHQAIPPGTPYHAMNPCTTVYQLVEELNQYLKK